MIASLTVDAHCRALSYSNSMAHPYFIICPLTECCLYFLYERKESKESYWEATHLYDRHLVL
jgi:hypothetical protein